LDVARALIRWYDANGRDLPWRRTRDPYAIWVAEVMLQQTRVAAVVPYWERFLARFPTVEALAVAREDDVLHVWAGLGYYRRARNLHAGAREIVARGAWPRTRAELAELPGVGPYTSASVAAIAFGERVLAVDGNVRRVARRFFGTTDEPAATAAAARWVPARRAGEFQQALFDLGATTCTPRAPRCGACPLARACAGRVRPAAFDPAPRKRPVRCVRVCALLERQGEKVRLERRAHGLLGGTWTLPFVEGEKRDLARAYGATPGRRVARYDHVFTHKRWIVHVYEGTSARGEWHDPSTVAVATAFTKALSDARGSAKKPRTMTSSI